MSQTEKLGSRKSKFFKYLKERIALIFAHWGALPLPSKKGIGIKNAVGCLSLRKPHNEP